MKSRAINFVTYLHSNGSLSVSAENPQGKEDSLNQLEGRVEELKLERDSYREAMMKVASGRVYFLLY